MAVPRIAGALAFAAVLLSAAPALANPQQTLGRRTLRQGMSGNDVRTLQADLTKAGFTTPAAGVFGPITARSVRSFERKYHLAINGIADASVVRRLVLVVSSGGGAANAAAGTGGTGLGSGASGNGNANGNSKSKARSKRRRRATANTSADPTSVLSSNPVLAPVTQDGGSEHLGERTLKQGMKGHDVRVLQSYLTLAGFPTNVDGDFGSTTQTNVVKFEQANGLATDGVVTYAQSQSLRQVVAKTMTSSGPVGKATLNSDGTVTAPAGAPQAVQQVIAAANQIINTPYIYGGGHGKWNDSGYDCSGAVSYALHGGNLLSSPEDSTGLESYGSAGPGQWITVYADSAHTFIVVGGLAFDTAHYGPTTPGGSGPRWLTAGNATANLSDGGNYIVRHPSGL